MHAVQTNKVNMTNNVFSNCQTYGMFTGLDT